MYPADGRTMSKRSGNSQQEDVDEMGTITLIESLDNESKKVLNALVQSVLTTQQENDKDKLDLLAHRRALLQSEQRLEKEKLEYEKQ